MWILPPEGVLKYVLEHLRHLDTAVVLALVRARADAHPKGALHWSKQLGATHTLSLDPVDI